ncbi:MAG: PTS sugar transporter subunit IIA [Pseudomonadota bacterium]|nr:PTS sugar transporter subunit IIA [Pseudomonadota bacterium]|tara:strand:- start:19730 stop:20182 length:453 start_codon:yes stop_codon:yes gene_type:complete
MTLQKLISDKFILLNQKLNNKKNALELISDHFEKEIQIKKEIVFDSLYAREKLGTTALGGGVALPHARIDVLKNIQTLIIQLNSGIDFDAVDGKKVDIIFVLLVPNVNSDDHVKLLAEIASVLDNNEIVKKIRNAKSPHEIILALNNSQS